jgi:disulfide bond formation protein DsbB
VICLRIRMVMMVMVMIMVVVMPGPVMMVFVLLQTAFTGAECCAKRTVFDIGARCRNPLAFDMMVMAFLGQADFILKSQNLGPVFAHRTVHIV